ncbi:hypothetical protein JKF63_05299 [Porcisia hertigi]|uniref:EF-hand domain-containing protein n=1 Tax=Porcisia hertigi TaxID=2761500 RepID=A0A836INJ4_9TRYP|nr:hypothetical protein JKF63_05299 [Porcisia hertigi]
MKRIFFKRAPKAKVDSAAADRKSSWVKFSQCLPLQKTPKDEERRVELFKRFDKNNASRLTMEEVYEGCVEFLQLGELTSHLREIVQLAFEKAKVMGKIAGGVNGSPDYLEYPGFFLLLCYIHKFFQLTFIFDEIDTSSNMLVDAREFKAAVLKMKGWGLVIDDADAVFKEMDSNGSRQVSFDEFAAWIVSHELDTEEVTDSFS